MARTSIVFIFIVFLISSCGLKIKEFNGVKYLKGESYANTLTGTTLKYNKLLYQVDSISEGKITRQEGDLIVFPADSVQAYVNTLFGHSKLFKTKKSIDFQCSRPPEIEIKMYPYDLKDTIQFDNLRFVLFKLVSNSNSFEKIVLDVDYFTFHFSKNDHRYNGKTISSALLEEVFKEKPSEITIDSVYYKYDGVSLVKEVKRAIKIKYPKQDMYKYIFRDDLFSSLHENSLKTLFYFSMKNKKVEKDVSYKKSIELVHYGTEGAHYVYTNHYYMNMGGIRGINTVTVRDLDGNVLFERTIDGDNQRIEDIFDFYDYRYLFITVHGYFNWEFSVSFI